MYIVGVEWDEEKEGGHDGSIREVICTIYIVYIIYTVYINRAILSRDISLVNQGEDLSLS